MENVEMNAILQKKLEFIGNSDNYYAFFGKTIETCALASGLNRFLYNEDVIDNLEFCNNCKLIEDSRKRAIETHRDWTIRMLENSKTEHTRTSLVMTVYNDIFDL